MKVEEIKLPTTFRPPLLFRIIFPLVIMAVPLLVVFKWETDPRDVPFVFAFWLISFSPLVFWLFQYLRLNEEGFVYSPLPIWPSRKVDWNNVGTIFVIYSFGSPREIQIGFKNGEKPLRLSIFVFTQKNIAGFIQILKKRSPNARLDDSTASLSSSEFVQR